MTSSPPLPVVWYSFTDEVSGKEYYTADGAVQWDHPVAPTKKEHTNKYARTETQTTEGSPLPTLSLTEALQDVPEEVWSRTLGRLVGRRERY